ncbi:hypothetical protein JNUCC1_01688 [Lentibacillus sp. JNUCC-1]|uniref:gas vesicle accessory protein GvpU n=1 Tax=Lentibacillus sp. JNUCC-1 TaxID=2654513 RepID=UPI0012E85D83|nr:gas vesicle accessory protein GvpU [Lentibacillus sp. JNUCC-1]MUV37882.1 hypothetical protein [Lentibacillus sp. JNUCC-1]
MSDASKDNILEFFVYAANKHGFELDITLVVNGAIVTGTIIPAYDYLDQLSESFEGGNDVSQKLSEQLAEAGKQTESGGNEDVNFIHLKNTRIYCGDSKPTPSKGKILWRGKLAEVDSFFLGKISEPKSSSGGSSKKS